MLSSREISTQIEKVHLDYLCENFNLVNVNNSRTYPGFRPDLLSGELNSKFMFELKSRSYNKEDISKKGSRLQCGWWHLREDQIIAYDLFAKKEDILPFWIFIIAQTNKNLTIEKEIMENVFAHREIYVVPWEAHSFAPFKDGGTRYIGINKIKKNYDFLEKEQEKSKLYLAKDSVQKIGFLFGI